MNENTVPTMQQQTIASEHKYKNENRENISIIK